MLAPPPRPVRRSLRRTWALVLAAGAGLGLARQAVAGPRSYEGPGAVEPNPDAEEITTEAPPTEPEPEPAVEPASEPEPEPEPDTAAPDDAGPGVESTAVEPDTSSGFGGRREPMLRHRLIARTLLAARANPLGLVLESTVGYRRQLFLRDTKLLRDSYLLLGAHGFLTPALVRVGPSVEIQPAAVIQFGASYGFVGTFGTFRQTLSYPSATADWGPSALNRDARAGRSYASIGNLVTVHNILQARVGRIGIRSTLKGYWATLRLRHGDRVFYDQAIDMLLPARGWSLTHDLDLVYSFDFGLRIAVRNTVTHAFYRQRDFYPGQAVSQPNGPTARIGPAILYTFYDRPLERFNRPTILLLAQWWYAHRFRTGAELSAGIPLVAIGFSFDADILPAGKRAAAPRKRRQARRPIAGGG